MYRLYFTKRQWNKRKHLYKDVLKVTALSIGVIVTLNPSQSPDNENKGAD